MFDSFFNRLKVMSPKLCDVILVLPILIFISVVVCVVYNSIFLSSIGTAVDKIGVSIYDLVSFPQSLNIFFFLILLYFSLSIMFFGQFIKFAVGFFLLTMTIKLPIFFGSHLELLSKESTLFGFVIRDYDSILEFLKINSAFESFYWLILISISLAIAIFWGKESIEIAIFGSKEAIPKNSKGKVIFGFIIAYLILLFLGLWVVTHIFILDLAWFFVEKNPSVINFRFVLVVFCVLSWWFYFYFWNEKGKVKAVFPSMGVIVLYLSLIQPIIESDRALRNIRNLDKIELLSCNNGNVQSALYLLRTFSSGVLLINDTKILFVRSECIKSLSFIRK